MGTTTIGREPDKIRSSAITCLLAFAALAALSGCAVNPSTGRNQLIAMPAAQIAYADTGLRIASAAQGLVSSSRCAPTANDIDGSSGRVAVDTLGGEHVQQEQEHAQYARAIGLLPRCANPSEIDMFTLQVRRIGAELSREAEIIAPDLSGRIGQFEITVSDDLGGGAGTVSSAGGRITISSLLATADPTDDVVAFLIAREMGHVIARHGEEDSGARLAFSVLTTIVPIGGLVVRFAASLLGSQALKSTWADAQRREADELALLLLDRCDRSPGTIALNLRVGLDHAQLPPGDWTAQFIASTQRVVSMAKIPLMTAQVSLTRQ